MNDNHGSGGRRNLVNNELNPISTENLKRVFKKKVRKNSHLILIPER